jgi:hypothetical protein
MNLSQKTVQLSKTQSTDFFLELLEKKCKEKAITLQELLSQF